MATSSSSSKKTVLLIGARGFLGSKVLDAILKKKNKYDVKALIREGSNASTVESLGVTVVRGDMMDADSLKVAFENVDVVVNTANGYMQGHPEVDTEGANNVTDAVKACKVSRYVFCSVLTADKAEGVDHFYDKYLAEEYMKKQDVPFISLRPGGFLDQDTDYLGDGIKRGDSFAISMWDKTIPIGMIYTPDLAQYFCDAIDLPEDANGKIIDVGWSRPVTYQEVVAMCASKLKPARTIRCIGLPWFVRVSVIYTIGWFSPFWSEMMKMFNYFGTGQYVNTMEEQKNYFGGPPAPEVVIGRYVEKLLAEKEAGQESQTK